jgi:signal transduction histidine kinase
VLNLLSNAFKFTFEGEIRISLRERDDRVELRVSDTGTGIPPDQLPRIFERFHRVERARSRSFEGTGIGLALVHDLAKRHGGTVHAESVVDQGSTFVVSIPRGAGHLPADQIISTGPLAPSATRAASHLLEAEHWRADSAPAPLAPPAERRPGPRVLVADDNPDMREHLVRLLSTRWAVDAVVDGEAALDAALSDPPDIVVSDVMMPRMTGVALLRALRADAKTSTLPFILLSARAEEESVVGGLETGADDYLVKPFSTRELMSRVSAHLEVARVRRVATDAATELAETRAALLADLERKNQELEAFSYSVSHDLRSPLRSIDYFTRVVIEDHGAALDAAARSHLDRVLHATQRMSALISDLLELARVERRDLRPEPVDLARIVRRIADILRTANPEREVELVVPEHVVVEADPRLTEILLENLLGNAWKFTLKAARPRVELGTQDSDGQRVFFVRDNGAGFDATYAERLFAPFERLHSDREFAGTGVGLATVKRIVTRHGGTAWAEGKVDGGATIYWTLTPPRPG